MGGQPDAAVLEQTGAVLDGRDAQAAAVDHRQRPGRADRRQLRGRGASRRAATTAAARRLPLHEHCLFKLGIHLGEIWHLTPLAAWLRAHQRSRFLLTAPPLRLPGAVGSPATPVATV